MDISSTPTPWDAKRGRPFSLPNIYEAPTVALSMAMDGGLTWRGMKAAFTSPEGLSPSELNTYAERMKDEVGRNPITDSLVDIVSNPFVWLWVVTAPWSSAALSKAGKPIFSASEKALAYTRSKFPWLGTLLAPSQVFAETSIPAIAHEAEAFRHTALMKVSEAAGDTFAKVAKKLRIPTLNYEDFATNSTARAKAERFAVLWTAMQEGHHEAWTQQVAKMTRKQGSQVISTHHMPKVDSAALRNRMAAFLDGDTALADELVQRTRAVFDAVRTHVVPDEKAAYRIMRTIVNPNLGDAAHMEGYSKKWINAVLDRTRGPLKGASDADVMALLRAHNVDLPLSNKYYNPHNSTVTYSNGAKVPIEDQMLGQEIRGLSPSISAFPSSRRALLHSPAYWQALEDEGLLTDHGRKYLAKSLKMAARGTQSKAARFLDHNPMRGMEKFVNDMTRVGFLASDIQASPGIMYSNTRSSARWAASGAKLRPGIADSFEVINAPMSVAIEDHIKAGRVPLGGFTVADGLNADLAFIGAHEALDSGRGTKSIQYMREYVIPRLRGKMSVERGAANFITDTLSRGLDAFTKTFGDTIAATGPWASKAIDEIKALAEITDSRTGKSIMHATITKALYSGHLASPSSVVTNMLQPLNAVAFLPVKDVSKGYVKAWGQVLGYMQERATKGLNLAPEARNSLILKHIPLAEEAGVLRSIYDMEEELLKRPATGPARIMDWTLKGFEKAEWANRVAVVEAVASRHGVSNASQITPMIRDDMRQATEQINFASSWWNTPFAFQKGRLSDPLLRMFATFPLRMFTYATYTMPNLVHEGKSFFPNLARVMGFSAVAHLMAKNLFGTDISKGLFYGGATDILPFMSGGKFEERDNAVPIPPIVDIPASVFKGLLAGDGQLVGESLLRTVPGGVFARRIAGLLPNIGEPPPAPLPAFQRNYIDWKSPQPDGSFPQYTSEGHLVRFVTPTQVVKTAFLGGMGEVASPATEARYLMKQREEMLQYRQSFMTAILNNDIPKSQSIRAEFQTRFQMPLTITQQQLRTAQQMRGTPRSMRMLERMPSAARAAYRNLLAPNAPPPAGGVHPQRSLFNAPPQPQPQPEAGAYDPYASF